MKRLAGFLAVAVIAINFWPSTLMADFTLVLKNGRRITVQSYREEAGMIKFYGLGGEIGISKDQIQSIRKAGEEERREMTVMGLEPTVPAPTAEEAPREKSEGTQRAGGKTPSAPAETPEEKGAKEEKEYQQRVKETTDQIKKLRDRYALETRGTTSPDPSVLTSEEAMRARNEDLISRLRDAQHNPGAPSDAGGVKLLTPSPFSALPPTTTELRPRTPPPAVDSPPPTYTAKEKELSELRKQINQLEKQREKLIEEMKQKNFDTGSLFLD